MRMRSVSMGDVVLLGLRAELLDATLFTLKEREKEEISA